MLKNESGVLQCPGVMTALVTIQVHDHQHMQVNKGSYKAELARYGRIDKEKAEKRNIDLEARRGVLN
jgi:hypothetical protein